MIKNNKIYQKIIKYIKYFLYANVKHHITVSYSYSIMHLEYCVTIKHTFILALMSSVKIPWWYTAIVAIYIKIFSMLKF